MAVNQVSVTIKDKTPLLMHRFPLEPILALDKKEPGEQCEIAAYRMEDGELYLPGVALQRAFIGGAKYSKGKGRASLAGIAAACIMVEEIEIGLGTKEYAIDARRVVIAATKGAVVRYRPRLDRWQAKFTLTYEDNLVTEVQVRAIVDNTGDLVGLLDFRPERKGPFGRFMVTEWKTIK